MALTSVFIDGDQGTTGLQIYQRLHARDDLQLITLGTEYRKDPQRRAAAINQCDVAILCLPDDAAREAVKSIENPAVRVIDASSAHRVSAGWTYGFAEMCANQPREIAGAGRVSNPGCYPTGTIALLKPLLEAGLVPRNYPISIHAVSGYSGKGRQGIEEHEGVNRASATAFQAYGLELEHKHVAEIQLQSGLSERPIFMPAYGAYKQGILLSIPLQLRLLPDGTHGSMLHDCLVEHYNNTPYVEVASSHQTRLLKVLDPQAANGTDKLRLHVLDNTAKGHVILCAVFDNLGKGAAGAAVQNLDLMLTAKI